MLSETKKAVGALAEIGSVGPATVLAIHPCPTIDPQTEGDQHVVTGTFRHSAANVLELEIEGESDKIVVTGHASFLVRGTKGIPPGKRNVAR